jgi:hypothetical protein
LEAKKICHSLAQGEYYYITPDPKKTVMDYVVKCGKDSVTHSVLTSLKKLCDDKAKFCSSANGKSNWRQLTSENRNLKEENERLVQEKKKAEDQLVQANSRIQELKEMLKQTSQKTTDCEITKNRSGNRITVAIKNYSPLRFVKVKSTYRMGIKRGIRIALTKQQANGFHRLAMQLSSHSQPIYPNIFKAVSQNDMLKIVPKFWIQEQTIEPQLYKDIVTDGLADKVSYKDAMQVIETLNDWCDEKAQFKLPEEKQFVYLARMAYNPIKENDLQPCQDVKGKVALKRVKQLLGHKWQLTSSYCSAFDNDACSDEQSRIKKGGSTESQYAAECMPEYRAESISDMREPNTTFRLVLKLIK